MNNEAAVEAAADLISTVDALRFIHGCRDGEALLPRLSPWERRMLDRKFESIINTKGGEAPWQKS